MRKVIRLFFICVLLGVIFQSISCRASASTDNDIVSIGENKYTSIQVAINSIEDGENDETKKTIVLLKSCNISKSLTIENGKEVILDLNGNTISTSSGNIISNNGSLTVKNGKLNYSASEFTSQTSSYNRTFYMISNHSLLTLSNVSITESFSVINNWPKAWTVYAEATVYGIYNTGTLHYYYGSISMKTNAKAWYVQSACSEGIYNVGVAEILNVEMNIISKAEKISTSTISKTGGQSQSEAIINNNVMLLSGCNIYNENVTTSFSSNTYNEEIFNQSVAVTNNTDATITLYNTVINSVSNTNYNKKTIVNIGMKNYGNACIDNSDINCETEYCSASSVNCGIYNEGEVNLGSTLEATINAMAKYEVYGIYNNTGTLNCVSGKVVGDTLSGNSDSYGIYNKDGIVALGENDGEVLRDDLIIYGGTSGINDFEIGKLYYYDGIINGGMPRINNIEVQEHYVMTEDEKGQYVYLDLEKHKLYFNGNGGTNRVDSIDVPYGKYIIAYLLEDPNDIPIMERYKFKYWTLDLEGNQSITSETMGSNDMQVYAQWRKKEKYSIRVSKNEGGDVDFIGDKTVYEGDSITIHITANKEYKVKSIILDGKDIGILDKYEFTNIDRDHEINVQFEKVHQLENITNFKRPRTSKVKKIANRKKSLKVIWKKIKNVEGYQIQYSTSSKFRKVKMITIKNAKATSRTLKKLKSKKKYYLRIRTYITVNGKKYYSNWSKKKSKKTK